MKIYNALSHSVRSDLRYYGDWIGRVLVSFYSLSKSEIHVKTMRQHERFIGKYFLDSGAFSAMAQGTSIDIDAYEAFIKENADLFAVVANLDVIGDPVASQKNQQLLEKRGLSPLPVFHYRSDFKFLERITDRYEYFALGGLVPIAKQKDVLARHLDRCFTIIAKKRNKVHLFGMSAKWLLEIYPAFSCDSTSAFEGSIRGTVTDITTGKKLDYEKEYRALHFMDHSDVKRYRERVRFMMDGTQQLERNITALWTARGITWHD